MNKLLGNGSGPRDISRNFRARNSDNYQIWLDASLTKEEMLEPLHDESMCSKIETVHVSSNPTNNDQLYIKTD